MNIQQKIELIEELLELDEGTLNCDANLDDIEEWDSLNKLAFMAKTRKLYGNSITPIELSKFRTVRDIIEYLR